MNLELVEVGQTVEQKLENISTRALGILVKIAQLEEGNTERKDETKIANDEIKSLKNDLASLIADVPHFKKELNQMIQYAERDRDQNILTSLDIAKSGQKVSLGY